ncbi:TonB-dependent receptor [uncultured Pseudoteredinibacter sp.]|uniref:TonB-dependent receptor n=1 Tax=uncultured Pseudoteredinibacter sp. TaxID=1641701 RepID=UPI0026211EA3|nr:TonB-dependent receptor [uncultured Pseudoteredinibacter sp.]
MKSIRQRTLSVAIGAIAAASAMPSLAQLALEEVVVTAQKREQSLMDVPISVNAVAGEKMNEAGISTLEDMTAYVPNLTFNQTGIGTIVGIRGISSGINQGFEQSVGQYVDGIYYGRAQLTRAPMFDMERVEILRGPQSILFGKNSIAGAVSMTTAKPTDDFEGSVTALYEPDHGERDMKLVLSGPLTENLSGRVAVLNRLIDGYYENTTFNRDESKEDVSVFRGSLRWDASDDLTVNLKAEKSSFDTKGRFLEIVNQVGATPYGAVLGALTGGAYQLDDKQDFRRQSNGDFSNNETENLTLNIEYAIGDITMNAITGYNAYEYQEDCDCDFVGATIFTAQSAEDFDQISQEIRFTSPGGETVDWIAGAFWQSTDLAFNDSITIPTNSLFGIGPLATFAPLRGTATQRTFNQESDLWSVFAQATWNINDEFRLNLGARYTSEDKEASRRQYHVDASGTDVGANNPLLNALYGAFLIEPYDTISGDRDEGAFTPLITAQWDVNADTMLYATWTTGFKGGGFDVRSNGHPDPSYVGAVHPRTGQQVVGVFEYEEEKATSIELGGKFTLAEGAAELNVALFRTEYEDLQTSQFDGTLGFNVTNAGEATSQGIEMDGRWLLSEGLTLTGSAAYLDFEYDSFPNGQCAFGIESNSATHPGLCDFSGERREFTPELQGTLSLDHVMPIGEDFELHSTLDLIYSDEYFASPTLDQNLVQEAYTKVNLRVGFGAADGQWEVALVGKNLTDEDVVTFGNVAPLSTTLTGGAGAAYYAFFDRPRSVAVQGTLRF